MATTAVLNLELNSRKFNSDLDKSEKKVAGFSKKMSAGVKVAVGIASGAMARFGWSAVKAGADAEETAGKFNSVFKGIEKDSNIVAKNLSRDFKIASSSAQQMLGDTGDLLTGFGFARAEALEFSDKVARLGSDLASFTNFSGGAKGAVSALTKALLGETESAKSLGIVIRQGSKDFKDQVKEIQKTTGATEQQAKTQAIWLQIQKQSTNAMGDFQRTQNSTSNRIKIMGERWKSLKENVGKFLVQGLEVDKILAMIAKGFKFASDNVNTFNKAIKDSRTFLAGPLEKAKLIADSFSKQMKLDRQIAKAEEAGRTNLIKALEKQKDAEKKLLKERLKGASEAQKQSYKRNLDEFLKKEKEKQNESKKTTKQAIEDAKKIEKMTGVKPAEVKPVGAESTMSSVSARVQSAGAFEVGSAEALRLRAQNQGNKTEKELLKESKQQSDYLRDIRDGGGITINEIASFA